MTRKHLLGATLRQRDEFVIPDDQAVAERQVPQRTKVAQLTGFLRLLWYPTGPTRSDGPREWTCRERDVLEARADALADVATWCAERDSTQPGK
jgi:hypothetical protein